jgi:hypothetical protein
MFVSDAYVHVINEAFMMKKVNKEYVLKYLKKKYADI